MSDRKRADPVSSSSLSGSPKTKGGAGRLIDSSRDCSVIRNTFVSGTHNISSDLVNEVSTKACEFYMSFRNPGTGNEYYHGQGGFLQGFKLLMAATGRRSGDGDGQEPEPKRHRSVAFAEDQIYEAIPVTAKHNLRISGQEVYLRTTAKCYDRVEEDLALPDGGCEMQQRIRIRPAKGTKREILWRADDISFGNTIRDPTSALTKASRLFEKTPVTFTLSAGDRIGVLVYRMFDITHEDAKAPLNTDLLQVYGEKFQVCIYTGEVTEVSENGKTFCHDANTFRGCSGAIIFLLDQNQSVDAAEYRGKAVGINAGGLDVNSNLGFLINH